MANSPNSSEASFPVVQGHFDEPGFTPNMPPKHSDMEAIPFLVVKNMNLAQLAINYFSSLHCVSQPLPGDVEATRNLQSRDNEPATDRRTRWVIEHAAEITSGDYPDETFNNLLVQQGEALSYEEERASRIWAEVFNRISSEYGTDNLPGHLLYAFIHQLAGLDVETQESIRYLLHAPVVIGSRDGLPVKEVMVEEILSTYVEEALKSTDPQIIVGVLRVTCDVGMRLSMDELEHSTLVLQEHGRLPNEYLLTHLAGQISGQTEDRSMAQTEIKRVVSMFSASLSRGLSIDLHLPLLNELCQLSDTPEVLIPSVLEAVYRSGNPITYEPNRPNLTELYAYIMQYGNIWQIEAALTCAFLWMEGRGRGESLQWFDRFISNLDIWEMEDNEAWLPAYVMASIAITHRPGGDKLTATRIKLMSMWESVAARPLSELLEYPLLARSRLEMGNCPDATAAHYVDLVTPTTDLVLRLAGDRPYILDKIMALEGDVPKIGNWQFWIVRVWLGSDRVLVGNRDVIFRQDLDVETLQFLLSLDYVDDRYRRAFRKKLKDAESRASLSAVLTGIGRWLSGRK